MAKILRETPSPGVILLHHPPEVLNALSLSVRAALRGKWRRSPPMSGPSGRS